MQGADLSLQSADTIRILSASMVEKAKSGHPGGPMGGADFVHILYSEFMVYDPNDLTWELRDRFYLDAGHMSAMLYSQMALVGAYSMDDLKSFRQWKSVTPGHPEVDFKRGIENTSGPLGLGHAFGAGSAIAERFLVARFGDVLAHKTYIYISDGGVQEEISQGVGRIAGTLGLGNITMFYDANDIQLSTTVDEVTTEDTAAKYKAWGWHVTTIDGNDHDAIRTALRECIEETDRPSLIIGKTVMGKGVRKEDNSLYEGEVELHGKPLSKSAASFEETIKGLGGDPANAFVIPDAVKEYYQERMGERLAAAELRKAKYSEWAASHSEAHRKYERFLSKEVSHLDFSKVEQKVDGATRNASGAVLSYLADELENLIVSSADLCNSDKTEAFLKKSSAFTKGDFSGGFLQAGVSELTMAALCTGMALHGGVIPVCATFFAFSDYMKPAIRVAALMEQQVIFLWTHDAFRVGEDGPTHQPVEQEAQLRLLEKLKNHSGRNSFLAMRPADADETTHCWRMALENKVTPSGMILSRQNVKDLKAMGNTVRFKEAKHAEKGGYLVHNDEGASVTLLANGSEVATLFEALPILHDKGIKARIVSMPSEGLFTTQDDAYRSSVMSNDLPVFALTAGLPVNFISFTAKNGKVHGVDHFGYSAPYTVLDEKFGFTGANVADMVMDMLSSR